MWQTVIGIIADIIKSILLWYADGKEKRKSKRKLRADKELADAIKRGDTKTVARIIKRNKEYKGLDSIENDKHCC